MLRGKELEMYKAEGKNIRVTCKDGDILEGFCSEFSSAYDNDDPEEASITLKKGRNVTKNESLYDLTEIYESEINTIEYLA